MFIQSQQLVTSSSSGVVQPKKRKSEHYANTSGEEFVQHHHQQHVNQDSLYSNSVSGSNQIIDLNHGGTSPGNQQPFVRASTIKLLDTYQRCGQKVRKSSRSGLVRILLRNKEATVYTQRFIVCVFPLYTWWLL